MIGKFHDRYLTVKRLKFHLKGEHYVMIDEDLLAQGSYVRHRLDTPAKSQFLAWMEANTVEHDAFIKFIHELHQGNPERYPKFEKDIDPRDDYYRACRIEYRLEMYTGKLLKFIKNYKKENPKGRCAGLSYKKNIRLDNSYYRPYREELRALEMKELIDDDDKEDANHSKYIVSEIMKSTTVTNANEEPNKNERTASQTLQRDKSRLPDIYNCKTQIPLNREKEEMKENYTTADTMQCVSDDRRSDKDTTTITLHFILLSLVCYELSLIYLKYNLILNFKKKNLIVIPDVQFTQTGNTELQTFR